MKKLILALPLVLLVGCSDSASVLSFPALPESFKDCKIASVQNSQGVYIVLSRCPNSTTTTNYRSGKTTQSTVVIDGETYQKVEKDFTE